jgi:hypothetical protein
MTGQVFRCVAALALFVAATAADASAQLSEWSAETRTVLSFHVSETALQRVLPSGWSIDPSSAAANRGANLNATMMERTLVLDGKGAPVGTGTIRYLVFGALARNPQTGQSGTLVVGGISPDAPGAYDVYVPATTSSIERAATSNGTESGRASEHWVFAAASGERFEVQLSYRGAHGTRSHADTVVRSAKHPEFRRTYHIDQTSDVVRSLTTPDRVDRIDIKAAGPTVAALFDGTEQLLSVTVVPHYLRDTTVP